MIKLRLLSVHVSKLGVVNDNLSLVHTETQIELLVAAVDTCGWTDRHDEAKTRLSRLRGTRLKRGSVYKQLVRKSKKTDQIKINN